MESFGFLFYCLSCTLSTSLKVNLDPFPVFLVSTRSILIVFALSTGFVDFQFYYSGVFLHFPSPAILGGRTLDGS